jgi:hypothetical protein
MSIWGRDCDWLPAAFQVDVTQVPTSSPEASDIAGCLFSTRPPCAIYALISCRIKFSTAALSGFPPRRPVTTHTALQNCQLEQWMGPQIL